jgi:lysozyme family protein
MGRTEVIYERTLEVKFNEVIKLVLKNEGGYVNDPNYDKGGETKYGISKRAHPEVDIKNLTIDGALDIYRRLYWNPSKAEKLMPELRYQYFDFVVNAGQGNAVKVLQKACNGKLKQSEKIAVDGRIGRMTIGASEKLEESRLKAYKLLYYANIVLKNPMQEKFWYGWYRRVNV